MTAVDQKAKKARRSGSDTLNHVHMREKVVADMKMKQQGMTQRQSEQQAI